MKRKSPNIGVGMPQWYYLNQFGQIIFDAFGSFPFLVGSAALGKNWRDVDVRLILSDEDYLKAVGELTQPEAHNARLCAFNMAFSELGRRMTGLPIDFQIQQMTKANKEFPEQARCSLILVSVHWLERQNRV